MIDETLKPPTAMSETILSLILIPHQQSGGQHGFRVLVRF
jgi:hypothetical protein